MNVGTSAIELAGFGLLCFSVALAGGLVGLVLGNLRLPASVSFSDTVSSGGGANVAISAVAATTAAITHVRAGRINWALFGWLAPSSLAGGFAGGLIANLAPEDLLLGAISLILFGTAMQLLRWAPPAAKHTADGDELPPPVQPTRRDKITVATIGLVVGVLGGAVGLILGALRLPALMRLTAEVPHRLVGTNLLAGVLVGVAGTIGHLTSGSSGFNAELFAVGAAASIPGAWLGAKLTGRLSPVGLVRAIGVVVVIAGAAMAIEAIN